MGLTCFTQFLFFFDHASHHKNQAKSLLRAGDAFILIYCQKFDKAKFFNYFLSVDNYAAMKGNLIKFNPIQFLEGTVMKINLAIICYRWFIPFLLNNIVLNGFGINNFRSNMS